MPRLTKITPLVLTFNEEPNIGRTLSQLTWSSRVVVVDSGSDDRTQEIVEGFSNTDLFINDFKTHPQQWNYGLSQVTTQWTLALDADYQVPDDMVEEIEKIPDTPQENGFYAEFNYLVIGHMLRRTLYPARQVLFRTDKAEFKNDGHTQRVCVEGDAGELENRLVHDDRKSLKRWLTNQVDYGRREADKITSCPWLRLSFADQMRRTRVLGPPGVLIYCLLGKGLILEGWAGLYYTAKRVIAEMILSLMLIRITTEVENNR